MKINDNNMIIMAMQLIMIMMMIMIMIMIMIIVMIIIRMKIIWAWWYEVRKYNVIILKICDDLKNPF